jgi:hypothetical protein
LTFTCENCTQKNPLYGAAGSLKGGLTMGRQILPEKKDTIDHGRVQVEISHKKFLLRFTGDNISLMVGCTFFVACLFVYMLLRG